MISIRKRYGTTTVTITIVSKENPRQEIQAFLVRMHVLTFAPLRLPKGGREITIYTSSPFSAKAQTVLPEYDGPLLSYFLGPDIFAPLFEELHMRGAKIKWIPGIQVACTFTGQILTLKDIRRLRYEIEVCLCALGLQYLPPGDPRSLGPQEVSRTSFQFRRDP